MATATAPKKPTKASVRRSDFNSVLTQLSELCASLEPGDSIPSHSALARRFDASEFSVLRALDELRREGIIIRRQGASTVVADRIMHPTKPESAAPHSRIAIEPATRVIGVVGRFAPEINELLVPYIIGQALEHALASDKAISLRHFDCFRTEAHSVTFTEGAEELLAQQLDALCVICPHPSQVDGIMASARAAHTPVVFVTEEQLMQPVPQVYIDHRYDGYQAANFLLESGYQELLFVMLGRYRWALERLEGVRTAFRHAGLSDSAVHIFPDERAEDVAWGRKDFKDTLQAWVQEQLRHGQFNGAVIAANDHLALDILEVAERMGLKQSRPFSILGFDDKPESNRAGLTTFRPPLFDMGREGARLLNQILETGEIRGTSVHSRLISQLVRRSSTVQAVAPE